MVSLTNMFIPLACVIVVANAIPTGNVALLQHTDCTGGTSYYHCGDHKGCFTADPCILAPTPSASAPPDSTKGECPTGSGTTFRVPSAMYDIFPQHPDVAKNAMMGVHLESYNNVSQVEQVLVFEGIPAEAKSCSFGWKQGKKIEQVFLVKGNDALSNVKQLSGFPGKGEDVTYRSIKPFDHAKENVCTPDFTNWDDFGPGKHDTGIISCAETLYFKVGLKNGNGNTKVFLGQDEDNGFYIEYTC